MAYLLAEGIKLCFQRRHTLLFSLSSRAKRRTFTGCNCVQIVVRWQGLTDGPLRTYKPICPLVVLMVSPTSLFANILLTSAPDKIDPRKCWTSRTNRLKSSSEGRRDFANSEGFVMRACPSGQPKSAAFINMNLRSEM
uniref:Uncharacterized protein n=1 Tax=Cacopsylla melanoneura TaxID=428564 RepID=A0A8D9AFC6_9HEMI